MTEIRTLATGEKITAPGAYRCGMNDYHSQAICPGPSISSSGLRKIATGSPHAFWKTSPWNPNRYPEKPISESLILGRAAHALLLGDEVFDDLFVYVPEDAPQRPTATQIAAFERDKEWSPAALPRAQFWEAFDKRAAGRMMLTDEQVTKIGHMAENLRECPLAVEALTGTLTEISLIWEDPITGLWVKSRPDCLPDSGPDGGDLKTFAPKGGDVILAAQRAVTDHGYAQQMALVQEGVEQVFGMRAERFALVFIQSTEPYEVVPILLDEEALHYGRAFNRFAMDAAAHGLKTGEWPFRAQQFVTYTYPASALGRFNSGEIAA